MTTPNLVQIDNIPIPPLRQSTEQMISCPRFYEEAVIKGNKMPGGLESARGIQIHKTMADYAAWCAYKSVAMDLEAFDRFAEGAGPVASRILSGMRDSYSIDFEHLLATELTMSLDDNFQPTDIPEAFDGIIEDSGMPVSYQGTLDAILVFREELRINIDDAKSHVRPFEPNDTLQAKMYAVFAFQHFPWVEEVRFRLVFVRYRRLTREVIYLRHDLPGLIEAVKAARSRQRKLHADHDEGKEAEAIAGAHCHYCPLLSNATCPIAQYNPQAQLTPAERLNFNLWYSAFSRANNAAMKSYVDATGKPIIVKDNNNKIYRYGPEAKESEVYPVFDFRDGALQQKVVNGVPLPRLPIIDLLYDYVLDNPFDVEWMRNLVISATSLKKYLKAAKRSFLDQAIEDSADKVTKVKMQVSKPLDAVVPELEDDETEDWEEEL